WPPRPRMFMPMLIWPARLVELMVRRGNRDGEGGGGRKSEAASGAAGGGFPRVGGRSGRGAFFELLAPGGVGEGAVEEEGADGGFAVEERIVRAGGADVAPMAIEATCLAGGGGAADLEDLGHRFERLGDDDLLGLEGLDLGRDVVGVGGGAV